MRKIILAFLLLIAGSTSVPAAELAVGGQPQGIIIQFQNAATPVGTFAAGLVAINCGNGLTCAVSGNVATLSTNAAAVVGGCADTQVLFDDGGAIGCVANFNYNKATNVLTAGAFSATISGPMKLTKIAAPAVPAAGLGSIWFDTTSLTPEGIDTGGQVSGMAVAKTCAASNFLSAFNPALAPASQWTCTAGGGLGDPGGNGVVIRTALNTTTNRSMAATAPITITNADGTAGNPTYACATCATTTNGGALSGTAPIAISAAGAISITGVAGQVLAGSGPAFTATPTLGVQNSTQGTLTVAGSAASAGQLILNIAGAAANALTIQPGANAGGVTLTGPTTGGTIPSTATSPITLSAAGAIACATCATTASGGSVKLSDLVAAGAANGPLASGDNKQEWQWAKTTDSSQGLLIDDSSTASTNGTLTNGLANQALLQLASGTISTATPLSIVQGSITNTVATPAFQIQTTWNNASLVGSGLILNATCTLCNSGSTLFDFRVGNSSAINMTKGNTLTLGSVSADSIALAFAGANTISATSTAGSLTVRDADGSGAISGALTIRNGNSSGGAASGNMIVQGSGMTGTGSFNITGTTLFAGGDNASTGTGTTSATTFRGGDLSGAGTGAAGATTLRGGNTAGTGSPGTLTIGPGGSSNAAPSNPAALIVYQTFIKGATVTLNGVECMSADFTVADCATTSLNDVGVATTTANPIQVQQYGVATVLYDATVTPSAGWFACTSATVAGKVTAQSGACALGRQVGIIIQGGTNVTSGLITMGRA